MVYWGALRVKNRQKKNGFHWEAEKSDFPEAWLFLSSADLFFSVMFGNGQIAIKLRSMFDIKETDFFDIEDKSFDMVTRYVGKVCKAVYDSQNGQQQRVRQLYRSMNA